MSNGVWILWWLIQVLVGYHLLFPGFIYLLYLIIGKKRKAGTKHDQSLPDYAIIVTAYKQTDALPTVIDSILALNYQNYLVYIVADNCDTSGLAFNSDKVIVLEPPQVLASNTASHFYAIRHFKRTHSHLTIIDSDNIVTPDYLDQLNLLFAEGYAAIQGERKAKNLDTTYACLDAARDIYYHFYDGKLLFAIGSSATLAGSGMAFTVELYRDCLEKLDIRGAGFDKVLQKEIVSRGHRIAFNERAIVYDEKTSQPEQLVNQRARWINTWFRYFSFGFTLMAKGIRYTNWNQFVFGWVLLRPPLFLFLIAGMGCIGINWLLDDLLAIFIWIGAYLLFVVTFLVALWCSPTDQRIYRSLIRIPLFIFYQVLSLLNIRKANQRSIATTHYHTKGKET
jgi:cellulose synthase/poly-beta-1,6-N-acetylglucosamine synthase-like glycosyltransferase